MVPATFSFNQSCGNIGCRPLFFLDSSTMFIQAHHVESIILSEFDILHVSRHPPPPPPAIYPAIPPFSMFLHLFHQLSIRLFFSSSLPPITQKRMMIEL
jgi:hypothetical protein